MIKKVQPRKKRKEKGGRQTRNPEEKESIREKITFQ